VSQQGRTDLTTTERRFGACCRWPTNFRRETQEVSSTFSSTATRAKAVRRDIHFEQDEWFYVVKGEYAFEIGGGKFRLNAGDTMFAPRNVTHGWANVGDEPGTLLTLVSPAGTFEEFLHETTRHSALPSQEEIERAFAAHNMKVVGPPLDVENL
jgi:mannose-6-phosphate isomerase-like protein (cupin superfamily)